MQKIEITTIKCSSDQYVDHYLHTMSQIGRGERISSTDKTTNEMKRKFAPVLAIGKEIKGEVNGTKITFYYEK